VIYFAAVTGAALLTAEAMLLMSATSCASRITLRPFAPAECAGCHIAGVSKTDMVWAQYYPLLAAPIE
jgi:hypothetical protein